MKSSFGKILKVTIGGGSHEDCMSVSICGLPHDFEPDMDTLQAFMSRRSPGRDSLTSSRVEADKPVLVYDSDAEHARDSSSKSNNSPSGQKFSRVMRFEIANTDIRSSDYDSFKNTPRPGHADYTARLRYGSSVNMSGGGPFSGRMTAPLCLAGGLAIQVLETLGVSIDGEIDLERFRKLQCIADATGEANPNSLSASGVDDSRSSNSENASGNEPESSPTFMNLTDYETFIEQIKKSGDSIGGVVKCTVTGFPGGIGGAMYDGLESTLSNILFGIPAVKGVDFGSGILSSAMRGSDNNDAFYPADSGESDSRTLLKTRTNNCGGILGGITTGMPVVCRAYFKPTPSISLPQDSVNLLSGKATTLVIGGRHDSCIALRAVPCVEAAVALGVLDALYVTENDWSHGYDDDDPDNNDCTPAGRVTALREEIDSVDNELLSLFERRMSLCRQIGSLKSQSDIPIEVKGREDAILSRIRKCSDPAFTSWDMDFFSSIFAISKRLQESLCEKSFPDLPLQTSEENSAESVLHARRNCSSLPSYSVSGRFGLIGHPLQHSFSKAVHEAIGQYAFDLFDVEPDELKAFINKRDFSGLCVTRPYKKAVIPLCDELSPRARTIGSVNTLYWNKKTGKLTGHNTDYDGFLYAAKKGDIGFAGKNVLILGTGSTSLTVREAVRDKGAASVYFASRSSSLNPKVLTYDKLSKITDRIHIIVNTTPVGTFPDTLEKLINVRDFANCEAVIDVVYNPHRTALLMEAEKLGLMTSNGLPMIVAQATAAAEYFLDMPGELTGKTDEILTKLTTKTENIVLIGMPGCGKTTIGKLLAEISGKRFVDLDDVVCEITGNSCADVIKGSGEQFFRIMEALASEKIGKQSGLVIATGGGTVLTHDNYNSLRQNGTVIWITRSLEELATEGRPLSGGMSETRAALVLENLYKERAPLYESWADYTIDSDTLLSILRLA